MNRFGDKLSAMAFFMAGAVAALILTFSNNWIPVSEGEEAAPPAREALAPPVIDQKALELAEALSKAVEQVAQAVSPAVVHISTSKTVKLPRSHPSPFGDDFLERFFPHRMPREYKKTALGSGIIVSDDGYILTNNHVVSGADELKVTLSDKSEFEAKVIIADAHTEVAVIKIDGKNLPYARLGNSDATRVGQWVIAIGNPFGFDRTVTFGIVSATGRSLGMQIYEDFIQTDAAINPGNSGGPLVDLRGEVIGINTVIVSRTGGYQGLGFAIPVNTAKSVKDTFIRTGRVIRGFLGVQPQNIDDDLAQALGLDSRKGAIVAGVVPGTAAERAGIKRGDVIISFDGRRIVNSDHLRNVVARTPADKTVDILINRGGKTKTLKAQIGDKAEHVADVGVPAEAQPAESSATNSLGIAAVENTPAVREQYGIEEEEGVVVSNIEPGSRVDRAGIKPGAVILEVGRKAVNSLDDYNKQIKKMDLNKRVVLLVRDDKGYRFVVLKAE
ncbi:MAG: DegQ family serine endoprotease [Planctomycetes bacterium]|nr:DegQ family serine endoprotease [Planctomycetota bacterium]